MTTKNHYVILHIPDNSPLSRAIPAIYTHMKQLQLTEKEGFKFRRQRMADYDFAFGPYAKVSADNIVRNMKSVFKDIQIVTYNSSPRGGAKRKRIKRKNK